MRRIRIYHPHELNAGITVMLEKNASHHLLQVLRKKSGERFYIFNGKGGEFEAVLKSDQKKIACVEIEKFCDTKTESHLEIQLGQGVSRSDRMDYAIQKATELGVTEITPIITEFCQVSLSPDRAEKRIAHWQAIAISAAEQSGRCAVPIVHAPVSFSQWIALMSQKNKTNFICCPRQEKNNPEMTTEKSISITIGAEGGFSDREIQLALQNQFLTLSLGPRVLRTETATVVAMTILQKECGDLSVA